MKNQKLGNPLQETTTIGPLARKDLVQNLQKQLQNAIKKGAKLQYQEDQVPKKGFFFPPTILLCNKNNPILQEETFGPLMTLVKVKDEKEAIEVANNTNFGLGASLWTQDLEKAEQLAKQIQAGTVAINGMVKSDPRLPFGGIKDSGYGKELGIYGIKEFTNIKTVVISNKQTS